MQSGINFSQSGLFCSPLTIDFNAESKTTLIFEIRATNYPQPDNLGYNSVNSQAELTTTNTVIRGKVEFTNVDENDTAWRPFFNPSSTTLGPLKINAGEAWGVYVKDLNPNNMANELVIKVYFYQG